MFYMLGLVWNEANVLVVSLLYSYTIYVLLNRSVNYLPDLLGCYKTPLFKGFKVKLPVHNWAKYMYA